MQEKATLHCHVHFNIKWTPLKNLHGAVLDVISDDCGSCCGWMKNLIVGGCYVFLVFVKVQDININFDLKIILFSAT